MTQVFQVLRCFKCFIFQVHQTKKSNKWECKLCGTKQSMKRHYGLGTAKDCRIHVQKLNVLRGEIDDSKLNIDSDEEIENKAEIKLSNDHNFKKESKWSNYVDKTDEPVSSRLENETMYFHDAKVVLEVPKKKRKKFCTPSKSKQVSSISKTKDPVHNCIDLKPVVPIEIDFTSRKAALDNVVKNITEKNVNTTNYNVEPKTHLNSNSKWFQYIEHEAEETCTSQINNIFSICDDDTDIDNILEI